MSFLNKFPLLNLVDGSYEVLNYLRAPAASQLLDVSGVEYLVYPYPDERKKVLKPDEKEYYYWYRDWFAKSTWLKDLSWSDKLAVFKTLNHAPRLYEVNNAKWVVGSHNTYEKLFASPSASLRSQMVVHLENGIPFAPQNGDEVMFNDANVLDLIMTQVPKQYLKPAKSIISGAEWWNRTTEDFLFVRNYLFDQHQVKFSDVDLGLGYSIAEGRQESNEITLDKSGDLYVRLLLSDSGNYVQILNTSIPTQLQRNNFAWVRVGPYTAGTKFKIITDGQINILNAFAIVPSGEMANIRTRVLNQLNQLKTNSIVSSLKPVSYRQESPTYYKIQITESNKWLVFSESFDSNWELTNLKTKRDYHSSSSLRYVEWILCVKYRRISSQVQTPEICVTRIIYFPDDNHFVSFNMVRK